MKTHYQQNVSINNDLSEHKQVKHDLIVVLSLNSIFLAIMLGLYFWNRATGGLDTFFADFLKF